MYCHMSEELLLYKAVLPDVPKCIFSGALHYCAVANFLGEIMRRYLVLF